MPAGDHQGAAPSRGSRRPRARCRCTGSLWPTGAAASSSPYSWSRVARYQESIARTSAIPSVNAASAMSVAHGPALHGVHAVEGVLQPLRVDAGQLVDGVPVRQRRGGEVRVGVEDVGQPAVEAQVVGAAVQHLVELGVVALAVLPAGGDGGDRGPRPPSARTAVPAVVRNRWGPSRIVVIRRARAPSARRRRASPAGCRSRGGASGPRRWPCSRPRPAGCRCPGRAGGRR